MSPKEAVEKYKLIIPDSLAKDLNVFEVFFLIAATYLHDIGMCNYKKGLFLMFNAF